MKSTLFSLLVLSACPLTSQVVPWTAEDVVKQERVGSFVVSPDGRHVAWIKTECDLKGDRYVGRLYLTRLQDGHSRRLVFGDKGVGSPRWSPDGARIAYTTSRVPAGSKDFPKGTQVWVLRMDGGEPHPVTRAKGGVRGFRWLDEEQLLVSAREHKSAEERQEEKQKDKSRVVEDPGRFRQQAVRLFKVRVGDGPKDLERVTTNHDQVRGFEVSPDGRKVVYTAATSPVSTDTRSPPRVALLDLVSGEERALFAERRNRPGSFAWRTDSQVVYAAVPHSAVDGEASGSVTHVYEVDAATAVATQVPLGWDRGIGRPGFIGTDDGFLAFGEHGVRYAPARYRRTDSGWVRKPLEGAHADRMFSLTLSRDGATVVYVHGSAQDPDRWCWGRLEGSAINGEKEFLRPNDGFSGRDIARREVIRWRGANGDEVEGILYFPTGYQEGRRYPLIAMPHGGPHGADRDRFSQRYAYLPQLYSQRGAFCLFVNYHGSSSYGLEWSESIKGRYYELEVADILSGIDAQVKAGRVDADRLGLVGWSNGAILSIACLTFAELWAPEYAHYRFKVCVPGAGDVNWTSDYGNCAFGVRFDDYYLGGPPWKMPDLYLKKSPLFYVEKVTTPTLIFFGDQDTAVPTEQGWQWYRALQQVGKAPVRFVLFPGQPHGLNKPSFRRRKMVEELEWVDRYLFGVEADADASLVKGSPLADALSAQQYARVSGVLGEAHGDLVVPETVSVAGVQVGRFEVTRRQWKSVFPDTHVAAGDEDLPGVGIGAEDAAAYVRRLSELTGKRWRLLTVAEYKKLPRGGEENTLDWWAGSQLNPTDAARWRRIAGEAHGGGRMPPLVEAVGSRRPGVHRAGGVAVRVHDAGGNVAEWVTEDGGDVVLRGPYAYGAKDDRENTAVVLPAYAGLRVCRE